MSNYLSWVKYVLLQLAATEKYLQWQDIHERPARTNAFLKIFCEVNICSLIINVKPELLLSRDLPPIALPSSPAFANTHVTCRRL
jgi:hypothetical protein